MADEIEKKFRLTREQYERLARDLEELGAEFTGEEREENLIYSSGSLLRDSSVLRIRRTGNGATLTFKKWVPLEGDLKKHIEHETGIDDPDEAAAMLELLGLELAVVYEKKRRTWQVLDAEVVLDELPFGFYMEIEGDPPAIREVEMKLASDDLEHEPLTYPRLTEKFGVRRDSAIEARFG
ncbi:MAG: class IV adenylate cyclase [Acidobacteriota bacterium]|nr:MAG: class IV adenylate cyclase [Acidobacteriota bacterium]